MPEPRAILSTMRAGQRKVLADERETTTAQQEAVIKENEDLLAKATQRALTMLGYPRNKPTILAAAMAAASTDSSVARPPRAESSRTSTRPQMHNFPPHYDTAPSHFFTSPRDISRKGSVVTPTTHVHTTIDINATTVAGGSSIGTQRKQPLEIPRENLPDTRHLFYNTPTLRATHDDSPIDFILENIFEGHG